MDRRGHGGGTERSTGTRAATATAAGTAGTAGSAGHSGVDDLDDAYERHRSLLRHLNHALGVGAVADSAATSGSRGKGGERKDNPAAAPAAALPVKNVCTPADYEELRKAYRFVPSSAASSDITNAGAASTSSTWQERMAARYHARLFREYALADLTRYRVGAVGLRWRTEAEVESGRGQFTCGNKHCPAFVQLSQQRQQWGEERYGRPDRNDARGEQERSRRLLEAYYANADGREEVGDDADAREQKERSLLRKLPHGIGLHSYEVNFAYVEDKQQKNELVKLRLCLRCAPMLFHLKGGALGARQAREAATPKGIGPMEARRDTRGGVGVQSSHGGRKRNDRDFPFDENFGDDGMNSSKSSRRVPSGERSKRRKKSRDSKWKDNRSDGGKRRPKKRDDQGRRSDQLTEISDVDGRSEPDDDAEAIAAEERLFSQLMP